MVWLFETKFRAPDSIVHERVPRWKTKPECIVEKSGPWEPACGVRKKDSDFVWQRYHKALTVLADSRGGCLLMQLMEGD